MINMTEKRIPFTQGSNASDDSSSSIGPHDVLLGRGGASNNHIGNRMFRAIVLQHQVEYLQARKLDKVKVAQKIVSIIQAEGGRFLKRTETDDAWEEASPKKAQEKTSQALREGLDVRHAQIRLHKSSGSVSSSSESSTNKTRKPYTIKQQLMKGKVKSKDGNTKVISSTSIISECSGHSKIQSVEEYAAIAIASLVCGSSF
jgi:hypothetical protein